MVVPGRRDRDRGPAVEGRDSGTAESFEAAGVRELREETGLEAGGVDVVGLLIADGPALTAVAVARDVVGTPERTEPHVHAEWRWFAPDEIPDALFGPTRMALDLFDDRAVPGAVATYDLRSRQEDVPAGHGRA